MWLIAPSSKAEFYRYAHVTKMVFWASWGLGLIGLLSALFTASLRPLPGVLLTAGAALLAIFFGLRFSASRAAIGRIGRATRMYGLIALLALLLGTSLLLSTVLLPSGALAWVLRLTDILCLMGFVVFGLISARLGIEIV